MSLCEECSGEGCGCVWQSQGGLTGVVLRAVFSWLGGDELARAGAACRAWRAAAAEPALWRRLLRADASPKEALATLYESGAWRAEYVSVHARWRLVARRPATRAQHAALAPCGSRLALPTDDATVMIWDRNADDSWREVCVYSLRSYGWSSVARAQWGPARRDRLLLAGVLPAARRWELLVLQQQEDESDWFVASRAGCSAGAAGCWAGDAFLALELRRLAAHYATTVWLNAATQETQSEYAGVTTPLLRVYNEERATITHVAVAEVPLDYVDDSQSQLPDEDLGSTERSTATASVQTLLCGFNGARGALRTWGLTALQPPPLLAAGDLRSRAAARRAAAAAAAAEVEAEAEPDELAVRAMCTPHEHECRLPAALLGFVVQADGRCAWASTACGAVCVSLPTLLLLRVLTLPASAPAPHLDDLHYVQPAVSDTYYVAPSGARSGHVFLWGSRSGAPRPAPLPHAAPALAAALPPPPPAPHAPRTLLVLAADQIYIWQSLATPQPSGYTWTRDARDSSESS